MTSYRDALLRLEKSCRHGGRRTDACHPLRHRLRTVELNQHRLSEHRREGYYDPSQTSHTAIHTHTQSQSARKAGRQADVRNRLVTPVHKAFAECYW